MAYKYISIIKIVIGHEIASMIILFEYRKINKIWAIKKEIPPIIKYLLPFFVNTVSPSAQHNKVNNTNKLTFLHAKI